MGSINIDQKSKILIIRFIDDYNNEEYKSMWYETLYQAKNNEIVKIFIDQSKVGKVSFTIRSWFIIIMLPLIKKQLGENVVVAVLPSQDAINSSRAKYFIKMATTLTSFNINIFQTEKECIQFLKK